MHIHVISERFLKVARNIFVGNIISYENLKNENEKKSLICSLLHSKTNLSMNYI